MLSSDDMFAVGVDQCWLAAPLWNRFCCLITSIEHSCCNEWLSDKFEWRFHLLSSTASVEMSEDGVQANR